MNHDLPEPARVWLTTAVPGSRLVSSTWLTGGIDHANHAVTVIDAEGEAREFVLRRWVRANWGETDPDFTVVREEAALVLLESFGARTPRVVATDPDGTLCDVPALLMTRLPGGLPPSRLSDVDTFIGDIADAAQTFHSVDASGAGIPAYRPYHDLVDRHPPVNAGDPVLWLRAMDFLAATPAPIGSTFIHRDYHPKNILWDGGRLTGVVDWAYASIGHPDMDAGHMRLNLTISYGRDVATRFRLATEAHTGRPYERYWDLRTVIDMLPDLDDDEAFVPASIASLERMLADGLP